MKMSFTVLVAFLLLELCTAEAQVGLPVGARMPSIGIGAFGGVNIPIVQDDQENGPIFGLRARFKLLPILVLEPNIMFSKYGAPASIDGVDFGIDGSKLSGYGIDATLGGAPGVPFKSFAIIGIGSFTLKNKDTGFEDTHVGYKGGFGIGVGILRKIDVDLRAVGLVIPQEVGGSKKSVMITGGLTLNL